MNRSPIQLYSQFDEDNFYSELETGSEHEFNSEKKDLFFNGSKLKISEFNILLLATVNKIKIPETYLDSLNKLPDFLGK
jgi:hypothetical protein